MSDEKNGKDDDIRDAREDVGSSTGLGAKVGANKGSEDENAGVGDVKPGNGSSITSRG